MSTTTRVAGLIRLFSGAMALCVVLLLAPSAQAAQCEGQPEEAALEEGFRLANAGSCAQAMSCFEVARQSVQQDTKTDLDVAWAAASCFRAQGEPARAIQLIDTALADAPTDTARTQQFVELWLDAGRAWLVASPEVDARACSNANESYATIQPYMMPSDQTRGLLLVGACFHRVGDASQAQACFQAAEFGLTQDELLVAVLEKHPWTLALLESKTDGQTQQRRCQEVDALLERNRVDAETRKRLERIRSEQCSEPPPKAAAAQPIAPAPPPQQPQQPQQTQPKAAPVLSHSESEGVNDRGGSGYARKAMLIVSGAALTAAALTGGLALTANRELDATCPDRTCNAEREARAETLARRVDVLSLITDGLLATSIVSVSAGLLWPSGTSHETSERSATPRVDVACGRSGCSGWLRGAF